MNKTCKFLVKYQKTEQCFPFIMKAKDLSENDVKTEQF